MLSKTRELAGDSKKKIIHGINEMSNKYKNRIIFNDKLICLIYKN